MSFISGLFGNNGTNFQAQSSTPANPVIGPAQGAVDQSQATIAQQQALANAIAQAGGVQNQQNVYNQLGQIASGQGPNPAQAQLAQATAGNVAQTAALQAGQRGASQNAGLIARQAGQQGAATQQASANQAATLQAQQSLNALGQQSGIAGNQVSNQLAAQNSLTGAAQNQAGQLIGANVAYNNANIQNAQQQNVSNATLSGINAQSQQGLFGELTGNAGSLLSSLAHGGIVHGYDDGGIVDFGSDSDAPQSSAPSMPSRKGNILSNLLGSLGSKGSSAALGDAAEGDAAADAGGGDAILALSAGGRVHFDSGGITNFNSNAPTFLASPKVKQGNGGIQSSFESGLNSPLGKKFGNALHNGFKNLFSSNDSTSSIGTPSSMPGSQVSDYTSLSDTPGGSQASYANLPDQSDALSASTASDVASNGIGASDDMDFAKGGKVPAMVSAGEKIIPPQEVKKVERGEKSPIAAGKTVHGKAKVPGDSLKNDTIPKNLASGSIVLPRSVTQSRDPSAAAARFVSTLLAKDKKRKAA